MTTGKTVYVIGIDQMIMPLTKILVEEGSAPNLKKLMENGSSGQTIPEYPAWTPTNWATLSTGAQTGTHGIFGWSVKAEDGRQISPFHAHAPLAERIWEAGAESGLRTGLIHYPASMPSNTDGVFVIDGDASPTYGDSRHEITPSKVYTTIPEIPNTEEVKLVHAKGWRNLPNSRSPPLESVLKIIPKFKGEDKDLMLLILDTQGQGYDRVVICREKDVETKVTETSKGKWSSWFLEEFVVEGRRRRGNMRFKLIDLSKDGSRLRLYRTQVMPTDGFTSPNDLGEEIIGALGPYVEHTSQFSYMTGGTDFETCLEEARYQGQWFAAAAQYLVESKGCELIMMQWHFLDDINHYYLGFIDPASPNYDSKKAPIYWDKIRGVYRIIDKMVETLMKNTDEDTYVLVVSDHGNLPVSRAISFEKFLVERGFLKVKDDSKPLTIYYDGWNDNVDWGQTKAYVKRDVFGSFGAMPYPGIYVNAEGEEYRRIQNEVIMALRTWVDSKTGKTPIAMALRKQDAAILGHWGEDVEDVVVVLENEYMVPDRTTALSSRSGEAIEDFAATARTALHSFQLLTAQTEVSSHMGVFMISGPNIRKGYERDVNRLGYIKMRDIPATLSHILGIRSPAQNQGSVLSDIFEGYREERERPPPPKERLTDPRVYKQADMHDFTLLRKKDM